jgi:hypothetical protein
MTPASSTTCAEQPSCLLVRYDGKDQERCRFYVPRVNRENDCIPDVSVFFGLVTAPMVLGVFATFVLCFMHH